MPDTYKINIDDILENVLDEQINFLNDQNIDYYIAFLKMELRKFYV